MQPELFDELQQILPSDRFQHSASALAAFQSDGLTAFAVQPRAIVVPRTAEEVITAVKWCHANNVPFVARGSGTSLSGASLPHAEGIVIALNRLDKILDIDFESRTARVEPGVINNRLTGAVAHRGLYYAPDPSSQQVCTI
ncbi:MAG TPA: FAD-binding oxidoreductase, partial [Planctomycetaceae bacterium]|nr:FAD-binding oxidoreductase [Planctomycetaceae bacterium]